MTPLQPGLPVGPARKSAILKGQTAGPHGGTLHLPSPSCVSTAKNPSRGSERFKDHEGGCEKNPDRRDRKAV